MTRNKRDRRLGQGLAALLGGIDGSEETNGPGAANPFAQPPSDDESESTNEIDVSNVDVSNVDVSSVDVSSVDVSSVDQSPPQSDRSDEVTQSSGQSGLVQILIEQIEPNPFQPRREFRQEEIESLAASLDSHQMLQPVLVRRHQNGYQLISGERRLRAATHAGWTHIPAQIREADDRLVAELAIVENLQRKDLNPIEKAMSFKRYIEQHQCKQDELAKRLKIDRSTIANLMRLLELPAQVLSDLRDEKISAGHARALLPLGEEEEQVAFARRIQIDGLSVRETERQVKEIIERDDRQPQKRRKRARNEQLAALEQEMRNSLGTKIAIKKTGAEKGQIVIHFENASEFDRLRELILGPQRDQFAA